MIQYNNREGIHYRFYILPDSYRVHKTLGYHNIIVIFHCFPFLFWRNRVWGYKQQTCSDL